jgi:hypothetical protein
MVYNIEKLKKHISESLIHEICEMFQIIRQLKKIQASKGPIRPKLTREEIKDKYSKFREAHPRKEFVEDEKFIEDKLVYDEMIASGYEFTVSELYQIFTNVCSYKNTIDQLAQNINSLIGNNIDCFNTEVSEDGYYEVDLNPIYNPARTAEQELELLENTEWLLLHYKYTKKQEKARDIVLANGRKFILKPNTKQDVIKENDKTDQDKNGI